ncbi:MAG: tRNA (adenosine(37)-N6)-dimethylallyltransferase MiaA [Candidatus Paceibacterota bacterium]
MDPKPKLLVLVGPTAVGKSDLAVELALQCNGEVISADSRQVYRGLDIGTGKITEKEMRGVPHHCLDIADPDDQLSVTQYKKHSERAIGDIRSRGKFPILVGGTGFYIQAVIDDVSFPEVPPDEALRARLEQQSPEELFAELQEKDPDRANTVEPGNKRRVIRALEIIEHTGKVPPPVQTESPYDLLEIGVHLDRDILRARIRERLEERLKAGMVEEAQRLHRDGLSYERMIRLGLEYRYLAYYLRGDVKYEEMVERLNISIGQYAKRQLSWFRRDPRIRWYQPEQREEVREEVGRFLLSGNS